MFAYCGNNPVNHTDREGMRPQELNRDMLAVGFEYRTGLYGNTRLTILISEQAQRIDRYLGAIISGETKITDIPFVDDALATNKIRSGVDLIRRAGNLLFVPLPTPADDIAAVGLAVYGVIRIVWGITDLIVPAKEEP